MLGSEDQRFIDWVEGYLRWYEKARKWHTYLTICKIFSLVSALTSIILAASVTKEFFDVGGKWLIVGATFLSALSSEWLAQFRVREMEDLRERGRIEVAHLFEYAQDKFDEFSEDRAPVNKVKAEIRDRIRSLEEGQHRGFVDIDSRGATSLSGTGPAGARSRTKPAQRAVDRPLPGADATSREPDARKPATVAE